MVARINKVNNINMVLDSGAFSSNQKGTEVDVYKYMDFIRENKVELYFNLDVIGSAEGSWKNQEIMEKNGFSPLPVFHVEDEERYLDRCISDYRYFALGGMAGGVSEQSRERFLDRCWEKICPAPTYMPTNKVHGLGLASPLLISKYPWASCDTASGIHYGRYGIIIIPRMKHGGKPDYLSPPYSIYITERSTTVQIEGKHIRNVAPSVRKWIYEYIVSRGFAVGKIDLVPVLKGYELQEGEKFTGKEKVLIERVIEPGVVSNGTIRDYFNLDFYLQMEKAIPAWPWPYKPKVKRLF